jgi:outer membrane lipoprotein carrier protein
MSGKHRLLTLILAAALAGSAGVEPVATQPSDPLTTQLTSPVPASRELLEHLQQQLKSVDTVQADFVQEKRLSVLNHTVTLTGNFALQKPNKLVWIVREPVKYAVRIDGEEIRQWDQDTNQVQVIHLGGDPTFAAVTQQLQAWFMGDYKTLGDSYDVLLLGENPLRLSFIPKGESMVAKALKQVDLTFGKSEQAIEKMVVTESSGDVTTLQFNSTKVNQPIPKETWEIPPHER